MILPPIPTLHQSTGPLTEKLLLNPSQYGLGSLPVHQVPDASTISVCGFCSTGCGLRIHIKNGEAIGLTPAVEYPVNMGMACPKGWESLRVLQSNERATVPLLRKEREPTNDLNRFAETTWENAINIFCDRFKSIQAKHGSHSVAFISTGQIPTEEMALLGCLAKFGMGMLHGDGNTRQCMATAAVAYKQSFGFDAPPFTYADFEKSDCLVFIGANPCIGHPILWQRVLANKNHPELIVIDPRVTETAMAATEHLAIQPKSDLALLYGIANGLIARDALDQDFIDNHTQGFEEFKQHVAPYSIEHVSALTGISQEQLNHVVSKIAKAERASFWWTMGVNQSYQGVHTAQAIINLALMTGNIGREGTGANSITGQCNAMGSRLYSNTTNLVGHHDFTNALDRTRVSQILDLPIDRIPTQNSLAYDQILSAIDSGEIRGLWIIATNTAHSWINSPQAQARLKKLEFLVVQDIYSTTETAQLASLVLPAAGWGEKEGTFINSERRFGLLKKVARAPGQALADFSIFRLIAEAWGCGDLFAKWTHPEAVFQIMKQLSKGRPSDISGIADYAMLDECGGVQWPWSSEDQASHGLPAQERRLFENKRFFHPNGKANFLFAEPQPMLEPPCHEYPFILLTGRGTVSQWHTQTRTNKSPVLRKLYPQDPYVEINPEDAQRLHLRLGDQVKIVSRRGETIVQSVISAAIKPGNLFMPMHYQQTNLLTLEHVDPQSRQPAYKDCAVQVIKLSNSPSSGRSHLS